MGIDDSGRSPRVRDYMTEDVETVSPEATVREVAKRIASEEGHTGYPVTERRGIEGFVTAADLLLADESAPIFTVMVTDILVAHPEMDITDAARVLLRSGFRRLPVVDDTGNLVGIISNTDVIRSQIERATPEKATKLRQTLENIHDVTLSEERRVIHLRDLVPTQTKIYADELEGRKYELERGLAEPIMVVDNGGTLYLADGHHRVLAADQLGIEQMEAFVIIIKDPIDLGLKRTAEAEELNSIDDIEILDYARHPLSEKTKRLQ